MGYRVLVTFRNCAVCGHELRPPQSALVAEIDALDEDVRDAIEYNESCERCWEWAGTEDSRNRRELTS